jgi:hypothetical protein
MIGSPAVPREYYPEAWIGHIGDFYLLTSTLKDFIQ